MNNKLYCTFVFNENEIEDVVDYILEEHNVLFNKIFVLTSLDEDKIILTYNIDTPNHNLQFPNTILVHRKKQTNTLYTINALNTLIKTLNNGVLDSTFPINWPDYKNSILLTQGEDLKRLNTTIHKIVAI